MSLKTSHGHSLFSSEKCKNKMRFLHLDWLNNNSSISFKMIFWKTLIFMYHKFKYIFWNAEYSLDILCFNHYMDYKDQKLALVRILIFDSSWFLPKYLTNHVEIKLISNAWRKASDNNTITFHLKSYILMKILSNRSHLFLFSVTADI